MSRNLTILVLGCVAVLFCLMSLSSFRDLQVNDEVSSDELVHLNQVIADYSAANPTSAFVKEVIESDKPVFVSFGAGWCPPCKILDKLLVGLRPTYEGRVKVVKVDVDQQQELSAALAIRGIPHNLVFENGVITKSLVGLVPSEELKPLMKRLAESKRVPASAASDETQSEANDVGEKSTHSTVEPTTEKSVEATPVVPEATELSLPAQESLPLPAL